MNEALLEDPSAIFDDPEGKGWLVKFTSDDFYGFTDMMDSKAFDKLYPKV